MQPEQPNQAPQPNNTPDYLGMEPVNSSKPKSSRRIVGMMFGFITLVLISLGGVFAWSWVQGESERQFYLAMENTMRAGVVSREFIQTNHDPNSLLSAVSVSDFSDKGVSKNSVEYDYSYVRPSKELFSLKGSVKTLDNDSMLFSLSKYPDTLLTKKIEKDLWYSVSNNDKKTIGEYDPLDLRHAKNTFIPGIPVGIIDSVVSSDIVNFIKTSNTFNIASRDSEILEGKQTHIFAFSSTYSKLKELDAKTASISNLPVDSTFANNGKNVVGYKLWVDDTTNRIVKAKVNTKSSTGEDIATYKVVVSYPSKSSISKPELINSLSSVGLKQ